MSQAPHAKVGLTESAQQPPTGGGRGQANHARHLQAFKTGLHLLDAQERAAACHLQRNCPDRAPTTNARNPATCLPAHWLERVHGRAGAGAGTRRKGDSH